MAFVEQLTLYNFIYLVPTTNMSVHTHSLSLALLFIYTLLSLTNYLQPIFGDYCLSTPYIHLYSQVLLCSRCCRQVRPSQNHTSQRLVMQALNQSGCKLLWMTLLHSLFLIIADHLCFVPFVGLATAVCQDRLVCLCLATARSTTIFQSYSLLYQTKG